MSFTGILPMMTAGGSKSKNTPDSPASAHGAKQALGLTRHSNRRNTTIAEVSMEGFIPRTKSKRSSLTQKNGTSISFLKSTSPVTVMPLTALILNSRPAIPMSFQPPMSRCSLCVMCSMRCVHSSPFPTSTSVVMKWAMELGARIQHRSNG